MKEGVGVGAWGQQDRSCHVCLHLDLGLIWHVFNNNKRRSTYTSLDSFNNQ